MTDEATRATLIEMSAQIEALDSGVRALLGELIGRVSQDEARQILSVLEIEGGYVPPQASSASPNSTQFYEAVADRVPHYASELRKAAEQAL